MVLERLLAPDYWLKGYCDWTGQQPITTLRTKGTRTKGQKRKAQLYDRTSHGNGGKHGVSRSLGAWK